MSFLPDLTTLFSGAYLAGALHLAGAPRASVAAVAAGAAALSLLSNRTRRHTLRDSSVLVTGASGGLGRCIAIEAARRGARVVLLVARNEAKLRAVAEEVTAQGSRAVVLRCDVGDAEAVAAMGREAREALGGEAPDVVVNNAGAGRWLHLEDETAASAQQALAVPAMAALLVTREFAGDMARRRRGHVLNVTSAAALVPFPGACAYQAARMAVRALSDTTRADLRGAGVGVSCLVAMEIGGTDYFAANPGSRERIPYLFSDASPLAPLLRLDADTCARHALEGVERGTAEVLSPRPVLASLMPLMNWFPAVMEWSARLGGRGVRE